MTSAAPFHWIIGALMALLLVGCPRPTQSTASVTPSQTPAPPNLLLAASPPDAGTTDRWIERQTEAFAISLPSNWEVVDLAAGDAQSIFDDLNRRAPDLARIIGSPETLTSAAFWAFQGGGAAPGIAGNLNIRRMGLDGQPIDDMQALLDPVAAQYRQLGFQVITAGTDLTISGRPAAYIVFNFENKAASDPPNKVQGRQYLVADDADLWILSFSATTATIADLAPVFERSALSFEVR